MLQVYEGDDAFDLGFPANSLLNLWSVEQSGLTSWCGDLD
jgi:hypothetical protein